MNNLLQSKSITNFFFSSFLFLTSIPRPLYFPIPFFNLVIHPPTDIVTRQQTLAVVKKFYSKIYIKKRERSFSFSFFLFFKVIMEMRYFFVKYCSFQDPTIWRMVIKKYFANYFQTSLRPNDITQPLLSKFGNVDEERRLGEEIIFSFFFSTNSINIYHSILLHLGIVPTILRWVKKFVRNNNKRIILQDITYLLLSSKYFLIVTT